jgi:dolichyl-phosphate beta-glucosyltransferase
MVGHPPEHGAPGPDFSLVFPAYNAAGCVTATWGALRQFVPHAPGSWEFLFVCDGCTDDTVERLQSLMTQDGTANARLVNYGSNRGKGFAVRRGMQEARGRWRIFTDVDLAYRFDSIVRVAETLQGGAEVAIASRVHPDSRLVVPPTLQGYAYRRYLQSLIFSAVVRQLLPLPQRDTQAGLKGLSARAVQTLLPGLCCNGFGFDCELLSACQKHGIPVVEVPVTVNFDNRSSTTSWRSMRHMLREIWTIRRRLAEPAPGPSAAGPADRQAA